MNLVTKEDIALFEGESHTTLAEWWCELNAWHWPDAIPNPEPKNTHKLDGRRGQLLAWIKEKVGLKFLLRVANRARMTDEEFEDFWNSDRDPEAKKRYDEGLKRRVEEDQKKFKR